MTPRHAALKSTVDKCIINLEKINPAILVKDPGLISLYNMILKLQTDLANNKTDNADIKSLKQTFESYERNNNDNGYKLNVADNKLLGQVLNDLVNSITPFLVPPARPSSRPPEAPITQPPPRPKSEAPKPPRPKTAAPEMPSMVSPSIFSSETTIEKKEEKSMTLFAEFGIPGLDIDMSAFKFAPKIAVYNALDANNNIGIGELLGKRPSQEDRLMTGSLGQQIANMSRDSIAAALSNTAATLEKMVEANIKEEATVSGSCLLANVIVGASVYTANIGDSISLAVILDKNGQVERVQQLNPNLHNKELINDDYIHGGRLAVNRSIGDLEYESCGLRHNADVTKEDLVIPPGGRAFVITACDGLTERNCLSHADIGNIVSHSRGLSPDKIAMKLASAAFDRGSGDNISVIVTEVNPNDKTPRYAVVADGHGGIAVSSYIQQNFAKTLSNELTLELTSNLSNDQKSKESQVSNDKTNTDTNTGPGITSKL